jgi:hypothetical protein
MVITDLGDDGPRLGTHCFDDVITLDAGWKGDVMIKRIPNIGETLPDTALQASLSQDIDRARGEHGICPPARRDRRLQRDVDTALEHAPHKGSREVVT